MRPRHLKLICITIVILGGAACAASVPTELGTSPTTPAANDLAQYFISPEICKDSIGPDCTQLRLGNTHLTTTTPAIGKLYACNPGNPLAPGSITANITWFNTAAQTWNLLRKPFLPAGTFAPPPGTATVTTAAGERTIVVTNLPVDGLIGDWPMSQYAALAAIDRNPGTPAAKNYSFVVPVTPQVAALPSCVSGGSIGVTLNGVVLYSAVDARGEDAVANEIVDVYGGHPAMTDYHYHFVPERLDAAPLADGHSGLIGYLRDGFGLYGYKGVGGLELSNADLDLCHGHEHGTLGYHYHATMEYPYTIGCYRGTPR